MTAQITQKQEQAQRIATQMSTAASWPRRYGAKPVDETTAAGTYMAGDHGRMHEWLSTFSLIAYPQHTTAVAVATHEVWDDDEAGCAHRMASKENGMLLDLVGGAASGLIKSGWSIPQSTTIMLVDARTWGKMSPSLRYPDMLCELERHAMAAVSFEVPQDSAVLIPRDAVRMVDFAQMFETDCGAVGLTRSVGMIYCAGMASIMLWGKER